MFLVRSWLLVFFAAAAALLAAGCSTDDRAFPRIVNEPAPLAQQVRAGMGRVGVLPASFATNVHFAQPLVPSAVSQKLEYQAFVDIQRATRNREGKFEDETARIGFNAFMALPLAATEGMVSPEVTDPQFQEGQSHMKEALQQQPIESAIHQELGRATTRRSLPNMVLLPDSAQDLINLQGRRPDFSGLASLGVDSVLDVRLVENGFEYTRGKDPEMAYTTRVITYVLRVRDGSVLHASYLDYRGTKHRFADWAADNARAFRIELNLASRAIVESLLEEYFDVTPQELARPAPAE